MMLPKDISSFDDLSRRFAWRVPEYFNIGTACSDAIAATRPDDPAILDYSSGAVTSFAELAERSTRLAAAFSANGIRDGARVGIMLPQCSDAVVAHLAAYKAGAVVVPLATQFGPEAIAYRLEASGAKAFISDSAGQGRFADAGDRCPDIAIRLTISAPVDGETTLGRFLEKGRADWTPVNTRADDPAMMLFTSGTTGQPKGTLHAHRVLLGHLPGIQLAQGFMPQPGDLFWTPSDWAWAGGLLNALLPALYFGIPVVAARAPRFTPDWALDLMADCQIRNVFMPPTALKILQGAEANRWRDRLRLRSIGAAGESLGRKTLAWAEETLGWRINEFYGQTECNAVLAACHELGVVRSGSMGKPVPGHRLAILDPDGNPLGDGEAGEVAIARPDPVMFLEYWNDPAATAAKFSGDWMLTGDRAMRDPDGYYHFIGRNDDVITSAGYRIGPSEIEDCLAAHPDVTIAAVVGEPDEVRTEIVSAFIKLRDGATAGPETETAIRNWVRDRLSAHEYPRKITFVDDIPLTESGKVIRRHFRRND